MQIISVAGREWVVGLWWTFLEGKGNVRSKALEFVEDLRATSDDSAVEYDCYAVFRSKEISLVGLGEFVKTQAKIPAVPSLAVALATTHGDKSWLGRFSLPGGAYLCCIHNGVIHPDGDFFGTPSQVDAQFEEMLALQGAGWQDIYDCPTAEESFTQLKELLEGAPKRALAKLKPLRRRSVLRLIVLPLILASACGWYLYASYQEEERQQEQQRLRLEQARLQMLAQRGEGDNPYFADVWKLKPRADDTLAVCLDLSRDVQMHQNGWGATEWTCASTGTTTTWHRSPLGSLYEAPVGKVDVNNPNEIVSSVAATTSLQPRQTDEALLKLSQASLLLYEAGRRLGGRIQVTWHQPETKQVQIGDKMETIIAPYRRAEWSFIDFPLSPTRDDIARLMKLPALSISALKFQKASSRWTLQGDLYVQNRP